MDTKSNYYGTDDTHAVSYLEYGSVDLANKSKKIWGYWQDQEAYDLYMFARYARDMFLFRDFLNNSSADLKRLESLIKASAHDKILDYIFKYAGIVTACNLGGGGMRERQFSLWPY